MSRVSPHSNGRFLSFVKEQKYLVEIFTKFDMNSSGYLETDELLRLIEAIGSGHVRHFADDDPTAAHAEAVTRESPRLLSL